MPETRQQLLSELRQARRALAESQNRVAQLEALLSEDLPTPSSWLDSEKYAGTLGNLLERSENRFQLLVEGVEDYAIYLLDISGNVVSWNTGAERLKGYQSDEIIGQHFSRFFTQDDQQNEKPKRLLNLAAEGGRTEDEGWRVRKDGSRFWANAVITALRHSDGSLYGFAKITRDLTKRKHDEENIRKLHRTLSVLNDINQSIVRVRHLPSLFEKACEIAIEKGSFRMAWIGLFDPKTGHIDPVARAGLADPDLEKLIATLSAHPLISTLRAEDRLICNDIQNDPRWLSWREAALRLGCGATVALPLTVAGKVRGIFNLYAGETDFFDNEEIRLMDEMAMDISHAMEVAEQDEQRLNAEAAVKRYAHRMEILHEIDTGLIQGSAIPALVESTLKHLRQLVPCQRGDVLVLDEPAGEALTFAVDLSSDTELGQGVRIPIPPNVFEGYDARHIRVFDDFRPLQDTQPRAKRLVNEGLLCALSVLLMDRERPIGVLGLFADTPGYFTAEHQEIAAEIASQLAIAIHQMQLSEQIAQHTATLEQQVAERTAHLTAAKERVEAILNNSPGAILLAHSDLTIHQANSPFNNLFSAEWDEYFGKSLLTLLHPDDASNVGDFQQTAAQQSARRMEVRAIRKDGTTFDAEISTGVIKGDGLVCIIRDITERKAQERQLRYYASVQESVHDAVITMDLHYQIQGWNQAAERTYGWKAEEVVGRNVLTEILKAPPEAEEERQRILQDFERRGSWEAEIVRPRKDGTVLNILASMTLLKDAQGIPFGMVAVHHDITERKQAEDALRQSEAKFRSLLDAAPIATIISDQLGRITLVNIQAEILFGYNRSDLTGQMVEILVPDSARDNHAHLRASYMAEPHVRPIGSGLELFARRKDGSEVPVEIQISYIETPDGIMVMSFILDITERKRIAAELDQQRSFLRNVIDVSPSMIFVKDYDARFVLVNPQVAKMYNTTVDALVGKTDADFDPNMKEVDDFLAADRHVITSGEPLFVEEPITNFAGKIHWLQTTKVPIVSTDGISKYVLGVSTDITERKEAEAALRESEEKYRSLIETMRGGLAVFDTEFRVTYVNDRFCELVGYSREEYLGKRPTDFVDTADIPLVQSHLERRQNAESTSYEVPLRHKDGHQIYALVSGSPLLDKRGNYIGSFVVATDISVQKQAEHTLQQALDQERELGELKTRFVSMASHEFRTPLASILALTETLSAYRQKMSDEQVVQRLGKIKNQVNHLKEIMDDVLQLARFQARRVDFKPTQLILDIHIRSVLDEFQSRPDIAHPIIYECNDASREAKLDSKLMRQIISNLVSNAIKYSPEVKPITVTLDYTTDVLNLRVRDGGMGIPEADLKHLFEPFHRAGNVGTISGTGLGLVITKESVELHGGTITVESQLGIGTIFTITIPLTFDRGLQDDENPGD